METTGRESKIYGELGVSSSKAGVHKALGHRETSTFFADLHNDACGDPAYYSLLHADGAGTKSIVAYLAFKETGDPSWFKSLAQDSLVMNLDDAICVNAFESLMLSNTIGRNKKLIPDSVIGELIAGYREMVETLRALGIEIVMAGGETADVGDLVRTIIVDSTLFARVKRSAAVNTLKIAAGDVIVGLSNTGRASYENAENSSLGSNGYTLARHALVAGKYAEKYPEILDPAVKSGLAYQGKFDLFATPAPLTANIAKTLLSPTRTYAPVIKKVAAALGSELHGVIHCSGGGQGKILRFGRNKRYIKDNLFPCPPVFRLIQETLSVPWQEMHSVFNMGHRLEVVCPEEHLSAVLGISGEFQIEARRVGYVEESPAGNSLTLKSEFGEFQYD